MINKKLPVILWNFQNIEPVAFQLFDITMQARLELIVAATNQKNNMETDRLQSIINRPWRKTKAIDKENTHRVMELSFRLPNISYRINRPPFRAWKITGIASIHDRKANGASPKNFIFAS